MKAILIALAFPALAGAQGVDNGTYDVYFQQLSRAGELEGCSLVFTAIVSDTAYLRGDQVVMNGSMAIRTLSRNGLSFTGKLGTRPLQNLAQWEAPSHFYFSTANGTTAGGAKVIPSDTDGYRLLVGNALDKKLLAILEDMSNKGEFTVGFNRKPQGQDVYTSIKMSAAVRKDANGAAVRYTNNETGKDFFECMSRLATKLAR